MTAVAQPPIQLKPTSVVPVAPPSRWPRLRVAVLGAVLCTVAGVGVMVAWLLDALWLLRPNADATPIAFNTGLAFALVGVALILTMTGRTRAMLVATGAIALLAGTSVLEELLGRSLGIDQLFFDTSIAAPGAIPGRIAINASSCFLLVAAALAIRAATSGRWTAVTTACAGGIVLAISAAAIAGYVFDRSGSYQWGGYTPMSILTASLFVVVAAELLTLLWVGAPASATEVPADVATVRRGISEWSVRRVVVMVALIAYVPLVAMTVFGVTIASRSVTAEARGRVEAAAALESRAVTNRLDGLRSLARALAAQPGIVAIAASGMDSIDEMTQTMLDNALGAQPGVASIGITNQAGVLLAVSPETPEIVGTDFSYRNWYEGAAKTGDAYVSEAVQSAAAGHPFVVALGAPVRGASGGPVVGAIVLGYPLTALQEFVTDFESVQGLRLVVTDQRGVAVATPDAPNGLRPLTQDRAVRLALSGTSGVRTQHSTRGTEIVGYAPVSDSGWTVTARIDRAVALHRVDVLRAAAAAVALTIAAMLTVVLVLVARTWRARREAERALDQAISNLDRSNSDLEQFAYAASHDLSEPLRAIAGPISLVARRYEGKLDPETDQFIAFAVDGCNRMQQLIDGLLAYSRVGRIETAFGPVDCGLVVNGVLEVLRPTLLESGATVEVGDLPVVVGEANQLSQVFRNLVSNAIKFARPGVAPTVHIGAERVGAQWRFTVTDDGIGIAAEHRERIFGMFKRLHSRDEYPGTGIGLALVRRIIERHDGLVGVEDTPSGVGSRFWFTLPAEKEQP